MYNLGHEDSRQYQSFLHANALRNSPTAYQRWLMSGGGNKQQKIADEEKSKWYTSWAGHTTDKKGPHNIVTKAALLPPPIQEGARKLFELIDRSKNPSETANALLSADMSKVGPGSPLSDPAVRAALANPYVHAALANPYVHALLTGRAIWVQSERAASQQNSPAAVGEGGSDVTPPFQGAPTGVSYTNSQAEADIVKTTPEMQHGFSVIAQFAPTVTSVMHGGHEGPTSGPNEDPHYAGRAVDVGAFGDTTVGFNQSTWNAIVAAIQSGQFSKIGTLPELADNAELQQYAKANDVDLFVDQGTGPHVHFEVPG